MKPSGGTPRARSLQLTAPRAPVPCVADSNAARLTIHGFRNPFSELFRNAHGGSR